MYAAGGTFAPLCMTEKQQLFSRSLLLSFPCSHVSEPVRANRKLCQHSCYSPLAFSRMGWKRLDVFGLEFRD